MAEVVKDCLNKTFAILSIPEQFHKMSRVEKARLLFMEFLEVDFGAFRVTRELVSEYFGEFVASYRKRRSMPSSVAHLLAQLCAGHCQLILFPLDRLTGFNSGGLLRTAEHDFAYSDLQQPWILSLIFTAIPALADSLAIPYLAALSAFFDAQPLARLKVAEEESFQVHRWRFSLDCSSHICSGGFCPYYLIPRMWNMDATL